MVHDITPLEPVPSKGGSTVPAASEVSQGLTPLSPAPAEDTAATPTWRGQAGGPLEGEEVVCNCL